MHKCDCHISENDDNDDNDEKLNVLFLFSLVIKWTKLKIENVLIMTQGGAHSTLPRSKSKSLPL